MGEQDEVDVTVLPPLAPPIPTEKPAELQRPMVRASVWTAGGLELAGPGARVGFLLLANAMQESIGSTLARLGGPSGGVPGGDVQATAKVTFCCK